MKRRHSVATAFAFAALLCTAAHATDTPTHLADAIATNPEFLEQSKRYTDELKALQPEAALLLEQLDLRYLHELDPAKVYRLNTRTGAVRIEDATQAKGEVLPASLGFMSSTAAIVPGPGTILGQARTVVTCPFSGQFAEVAGFMASVNSRDPVGGLKPGFIYADDFLTTGARRQSNRVLQSDHKSWGLFRGSLARGIALGRRPHTALDCETPDHVQFLCPRQTDYAEKRTIARSSAVQTVGAGSPSAISSSPW